MSLELRVQRQKPQSFLLMNEIEEHTELEEQSNQTPYKIRLEGEAVSPGHSNTDLGFQSDDGGTPIQKREGIDFNHHTNHPPLLLSPFDHKREVSAFDQDSDQSSKVRDCLLPKQRKLSEPEPLKGR